MSSAPKSLACKPRAELQDRYAELSLGVRCRLVWGKLRRFYLLHFRPGYVRRALARRRGACARTGACCQLGFGCPLARETEHTRDVECRSYRLRPPNCRIFPIDERDLRDRDLVMPETPCGYHFAPEPPPAQRAAKR